EIEQFGFDLGIGLRRGVEDHLHYDAGAGVLGYAAVDAEQLKAHRFPSFARVSKARSSFAHPLGRHLPDEGNHLTPKGRQIRGVMEKAAEHKVDSDAVELPDPLGDLLGRADEAGFEAVVVLD